MQLEDPDEPPLLPEEAEEKPLELGMTLNVFESGRALEPWA
jgi:hypothetical protein